MFDVDTFSSPTILDIWKLILDSKSKISTTMKACLVVLLTFNWDKTRYSQDICDNNQFIDLCWGEDKFASNVAYFTSYFALISSFFFIF